MGIRISGRIKSRYLTPALAAVMAIVAMAAWYELERSAPTSTSASIEPEPTPEFSFARLDQPRALPELHFIDGGGRAMTLADFRGRAVLLNLWATWCVPCRKEMPTLDRLQAKLGGPGFQVVPLSIDRQGLSVVEPFYRELGLKALGVYVDQSGEAATGVGAVGIPTTLLVDKAGREIARKAGPAEWDDPEMIDAIRRYLEPPSDTDQPSAGAASPASKTAPK